jgi:hypothetical protein
MYKTKHNVVVSCSPEEHTPVLLGYSHNLKSENVCICESTVLFQTDSHSVVKKTATIKEKELDIFLTYSYLDGREYFLRGFLYTNNKEYIIQSCYIYSSLQIGKYAYDRIMVVKLTDNIFD